MNLTLNKLKIFQAPRPPPKILPRVIITYGACARGGGRRQAGLVSRAHRIYRAGEGPEVRIIRIALAITSS